MGVGPAVDAGVGVGAAVGVGAVGAEVGAGVADGAEVGAAVGAEVVAALGLAKGAGLFGPDVAGAARGGDGVGVLTGVAELPVRGGAEARRDGLAGVVDAPVDVDDVVSGIGDAGVCADRSVMSPNAGAELALSVLPPTARTFVVAPPTLGPPAKIWAPAANIAHIAMIATPTRRITEA